ncbi:S-layer homology domain-containing protein [Paenibacillus turpanensis]|uniref:S-layer homology domain-containing protein n=1 Tax=Paenibacillus turpanensis TaxID=2689078 RepID=UPI00140BF664|nr:S-layer homology domain-containing protein [Paenibacillus turpanensis]
MRLAKVKKHLLISASCAALFLGVQTGTVQAADFQDLKGHWAQQLVDRWTEQGAAKGYEDASFRPDAPISRAEFVALTNRMLGFTATQPIDFVDISKSDWFYEELQKAVEAGYIQGYEDATIRPTQQISRAEAAVIAARLMQLSPVESSNVNTAFSDEEMLGWSKGWVKAVVDQGIMSGYTEDRAFRPQQPITRAEALVTLDRVAQQVLDGVPSLENVTYTQSGVYGPKGNEPQTIRGNVVVSAGQVTLQNMIIEGDLTITKAVGEEDVRLKHVTVAGTTRIQGGGENSIHITDSELGDMEVSKPNGSVRIVSEGSSSIQNATLATPAKLEELNGSQGEGFQTVSVEVPSANSTASVLAGDFTSVNIVTPKAQVEFTKGNVEEMKVDGRAVEASIHVASGARIKLLTLDAKTTVTGTGPVDKVVATKNADGSVIQQQVVVELPSGVQIRTGVASGYASSGSGTRSDSGSDDSDDSDDGSSEALRELAAKKYIVPDVFTIYEFTGKVSGAVEEVTITAGFKKKRLTVENGVFKWQFAEKVDFSSAVITAYHADGSVLQSTELTIVRAK